MIQDIGEHVYNNHFEPHEPVADSVVLHYADGAVLCRVGGGAVELPCLADLPEQPHELQYLFSIDGTAFFLAQCDGLPAPEGFSYQAVYSLRQAGASWPVFAAVTGRQLHDWYRDNRFCGTCGRPTQVVPTSREICCPACNRVIYPKISPGVIVGVIDPATERIVLTKYANRPFAHYALVAGFTEIGESIEQTVAREVMEEVGLRVKNLRFYKSQPWSFSDSLLVGFFCEVDGSTQITVDHTELKEAAWLTCDEMPTRADDSISLTGEMMRRFRAIGNAVLER